MSETGKEWRLPKNTRQVGDGCGEKKLYVEDYVVTYLNQIAEQKETAKVLLLGTIREWNLYPYIFVDAALEIEDFHMDDTQKEEVQKEIRELFGIRKIVGWFLSSRETPVLYNQEMLETYQQLFAEENQVLMTADPMEEELTAFFLEDEMLTEQPGYMIYYEKNIPMQNLLIRKKEERVQEQGEMPKDGAIHHFRKILKMRKTEKEAEKKNDWLSYIASGFLVMTVLALGVTMIYNYDKMKQVEESLAILSDHVDSQKEYVTDYVEPVQDVISYIKEESESVSETTDLAVEEEILTGTQTLPETEEITEMLSETESETQTEPEDAVRTSGPLTARASYTVKVGDTLAQISEMYYGNLDKVQDICSLNGISDEDTILPGQKILLP